MAASVSLSLTFSAEVPFITPFKQAQQCITWIEIFSKWNLYVLYHIAYPPNQEMAFLFVNRMALLT